MTCYVPYENWGLRSRRLDTYCAFLVGLTIITISVKNSNSSNTKFMPFSAHTMPISPNLICAR